MMHLLAGLRRTLIAVLAIVNVGASPLAMLGESQLMAASVAQGLHKHIEEHSQPGCAPVHTDQCILCDFLAHVTPERPSAKPMFSKLSHLVRAILDSPNADTRRPVIDSNFESAA